METYNLHINGKKQEVTAPEDMPLLWVLRDLLQLKGTKFGCGQALCGACTVHLDDIAVRSCSLPISEVGNGKITTIEGLSKEGTHPLQEAWVENVVPQCGYCQGGQIMSAAALLKQNPSPTEEEIESVMQGNLCRCGTYNRIKEAILTASKH
ncbi:(2Fe-2S)-binding protein [Algoriphagus sanaruensis]|uniref:(2Fe-2S)-binding protein n=1 Tax=Algoriphagus sanaruensis TaxID=1727163 RepID=A0A142ERW9_9BACT|nr:(2Fe-2S)-binding protein [Algoriphagus sanaruensis]AMQ57874.1 (2Fe-2S)-binding protein [Algoriphagus sanaruensis]